MLRSLYCIVFISLYKYLIHLYSLAFRVRKPSYLYYDVYAGIYSDLRVFLCSASTVLEPALTMLVLVP